jgi:cysteine-rich repeat protein
MDSLPTARFPLFLVGMLALGGCGDDSPGPQGGQPEGGAGGGAGDVGAGGSGGSGGEPYTGPCTPLTLGDTMVYYEAFGRGTIAPATPPLEGTHHTRLTMELYEDDGSGALPPLANGTFSFGVAPDDNYGTCQHCALLVGYSKSDQPLRAFYPKNGSFTLTSFDENDWSSVAGRIDAMELYEVEQSAEDFSWSFTDSDECFYVASWPFDTLPVDGGKCDSNEQCPNELLQVCSPATNTCGPMECTLLGDPPFCGNGEVCLSQLFDPDESPAGPALGACYTTCEPGDDASCGDGNVCRVLGPTQSLGICMQLGTAAMGAACTPRDNSTECAAGAVCWGEPGECLKECIYLDESSTCPADRFCTVSNLCKPASFGDSNDIGEFCEAESPELTECGIEGDSYRGVCVKWFLEEPFAGCERLCRTADPECPTGESCLPLFENDEIGACAPTPVCGDGEISVLGGELCDDGNTVDGDACSSDCLAADFSFLCGEADPLVLGTPIAGDTSSGPGGYPTQCDPYVATRSVTYSFMPAAPGRLTLDLTSTAEIGINLLASCADPSSHLACSNDLGDEQLIYDVVTLPAQPILIVVRGQSPIQAGTFTLTANYQVAVCGDGSMGGPEACDDGNTTSGDGCSADCLAVEWPEVCAALPVLPMSQTGTTVGGSDIYALDGVCAFDPQAARAFSFVAPSDGTLHVELEQPDERLVVYVQDGCGPVTGADFLACANFAWEGETNTLDAPLGEDQLVTVIVAGFDSTGGAFTLTSSFTP